MILECSSTYGTRALAKDSKQRLWYNEKGSIPSLPAV